MTVVAPATSRHKYQFPDRATAEAAHRGCQEALHLQLRLARALYAGRVSWTRPHGSYRAGLFDQHTHSGGRLAWVFFPECNGEPNIDVYALDDDPIRVLESNALRFCRGDECDDIRAVCRELRNMLAKEGGRP